MNEPNEWMSKVKWTVSGHYWRHWSSDWIPFKQLPPIVIAQRCHTFDQCGLLPTIDSINCCHTSFFLSFFIFILFLFFPFPIFAPHTSPFRSLVKQWQTLCRFALNVFVGILTGNRSFTIFPFNKYTPYSFKMGFVIVILRDFLIRPDSSLFDQTLKV